MRWGEEAMLHIGYQIGTTSDRKDIARVLLEESECLAELPRPMIPEPMQSQHLFPPHPNKGYPMATILSSQRRGRLPWRRGSRRVLHLTCVPCSDVHSRDSSTQP